MFYLNTVDLLFLIVEQLDQLEVCLPYSRLLTGIPILVVFQNLRWNSNKTSLLIFIILNEAKLEKIVTSKLLPKLSHYLYTIIFLISASIRDFTFYPRINLYSPKPKNISIEYMVF